MYAKIMLAESDALVRAGIKLLVETDSEMKVTAEAGNAESCMEKLKAFDKNTEKDSGIPQLLILSIPMEGGTEEQLMQECKRRIPGMKILVLVGRDGKMSLEEALKAGADAYLLKKSEPEEFKAVLKIIITGKKYISSDISEKQVKKHIKGGKNQISVPNIPQQNAAENDGVTKTAKSSELHKFRLLTPREREVLVLTAGGRLNKEIADLMKISERTVKNHLTSIYKKLEISDRTQAALYAVRNHITEA